jgi:prevent-host-death family protein
VAYVTIRDLRNGGDEVLDRVLSGEHLVVTRDGRPVAALSPLKPAALPVEKLLERWRRLPAVDAAAWRADIGTGLASITLMEASPQAVGLLDTTPSR